jgi:polysaccharide chain length determinant protein (PEP-CTERM system associated)
MDFQKTLAWVIEDAQRMWEFRWVGLLCAWIIAAGGWLTVQLLPNKYEASARVYVNAEGILKPLLRDLTVPTDPIEQVKLMTRALLSRPHLETVITKTGLVDRARNPAERERLLLRLEETILVMRPQEADDDQVYTIAYDDHDPAMAQAVVQTLLDDFITDSMTGDVAESAQAQAFLEGQLKIYEQRLTDAENRLADFKTKNMGLVQGEGDFYGRFQAVQAEVTGLRSQISSLTDKRNELERQLAGETGNAANEQDPLRSSSVDGPISNLEAEIAQLQLRFTDKHPDVVRNRQTLEDLYKIREEELRALAAGGTAASSRRTVDPVSQRIKIALSAADAELASLRAQFREKSAQVNYLRGMANTIPEVEAQLVRLNRDYTVIKTEYETLLQRLESARMNQDVQADKKDVSFKVLDPPRIPLVPVSPNRLLLNTLVLLGAIGCGLGLAYILSQHDPTFYSAASLSEVAGVPVYGLVGVAGTAQPDGPGKWRFEIATGALLLAFVLVVLIGRILT